MNEGLGIAIFIWTKYKEPYHPGNPHQNNYIGMLEKLRISERRKESPEGKHRIREREGGTEMGKGGNARKFHQLLTTKHTRTHTNIS